MSLLSAPEFMRYIRASAGRAGLNVVWENVNLPRHDGKTIYLPRITKETTKEDLLLFRSSVDHEIAHDKFSDFKILEDNKDLLKASQMLMFVWNFLEDSRINTLEAKEYRGFRDTWDITSPALFAGIAKNFKEHPSPLGELITSMIVWEADINKDLFPQIKSCADDVFKAQEKILEMLQEHTEALIEAQETRDKVVGSGMTFAIAKKILKIDKKKEDELKEKAKEKSEEGESTEVKESLEESELGGEGEEEKDDDKYRVIEVKITKEDLEKYSLSTPEHGRDMKKTGVNFDVATVSKYFSYEDWYLTDFDNFKVVDYPRNLGNDAYLYGSESSFIPEYEARVGKRLVSEEGFAQQVRRLIQIRAKVQTQYGVTRGKLDQSRLSRVCFNAPGLSERVFKNKIKNTTLDSAITVLVDMSGSMGGDKVYYALGAAILMNEVCFTLNIPLEILGFTDTSSGTASVPLMFIYKGFNNTKIAPDDLKAYLSKSSRHMSGNPDGENIIWAYDRLLKRKEKNRVMIVMSDGNPAASRASSGIIPFTKKTIETIEAEKKVSIYGLGLLSRSVVALYKDHSVVNRAEEIPHKLLELFEKRIIRND